MSQKKMYSFPPQDENCVFLHYSKLSLVFAVTSTCRWPHQPQQGTASLRLGHQEQAGG